MIESINYIHRYAVVQTRLLYWTNQTSATIDERRKYSYEIKDSIIAHHFTSLACYNLILVACDVPLYFDAGTNNCVRQCPLFTFGNHTVAECQPCELHAF